MMKSLKHKKVILVILILPGLIYGSLFALRFIRGQENRRMTDTLAPYVRESFSAEGVPMPENPFFVLYDLDKKAFNVVYGRKYPLGTNDASKVSVVIAYQTRRDQVGRWVDSTDANQVYSNAYAAFADVYVIRLADWALIEKQSFQSPVTKPDENKSSTDYADMLAATGADKYIEALLEGKPTENTIPRQPDSPRQADAPAEAPAIPDIPDAADLPAAPDLPNVNNLPSVPQMPSVPGSGLQRTGEDRESGSAV